MNRFPLFVDLQGKKVVIAGGDEEAERKARLVAKAGATIVVITAAVDRARFEGLRDDGAADVAILAVDPAPADFEGAALAIIADVDELTAARYAKWARKAGALVNVVDRPGLCDFTTPSIIDRDDVVIAISTGGAAPVLGQRLRGKIEALLPARLGALARFAKSFRDDVKKSVPASARRKLWGKVFDGPVGAHVLAGDEPQARRAMRSLLLNQPADDRGESAGVVHIVGAGPGDPELLTLRAHRLVQEADVILYDRLVSDAILDLARRDAERLFVGKAKADHAVPQADIERLMVEHARAGKTVVRLKSGDPFVFGRGGEELEAMHAAGVDAHVTPGITAATGCAAAVGMALTHRNHAQAVTFVTGHAQNGPDPRGSGLDVVGRKAESNEPDIDWASLVKLNQTLVIYMGVTTAETISQCLIRHGASPQTPAAIIENGSRPEQKLVKGRLADLAVMIGQHAISGPALLVIGDVAALADDRFAEQISARGATEERLSA